ncbi:hypothetical protein Mame01_14070 [Microbispora amethystogenes]|nr:hypothetical protein Mame01_14070 [Microbispora amethystogenes]
MFSSKYGKCQAGSISATPSAEMNSVEMIFAIVTIPSVQVAPTGRPAQPPEPIGRDRQHKFVRTARRCRIIRIQEAGNHAPSAADLHDALK